MHVNFKTDTGGESYNGLFKRSGLDGIVGTRDICMLDNISTFTGAVENRRSSTEQDAPVEDAMIHHVELLGLLYCGNGPVG